ncbi:MAG TPA: dihydroorotate dehydrogenase [Candidatus Limnocylindrales bacterium]|nr:dihydroorotate dehydrogenase [Candidatus Limnocylindrales bacterium]
MKAKRRVVTTSGRRSPAKRTPSVPSIRPTIAPATPRPRLDGVTAGQPVDAVNPISGDIDLTVDLGRGLVLPNPILVASGTFGYGIEYGDVVEVDRLGAICCKGTTLKPRIGNPTPRVTETPGGMLNSIGLQNPGVDAVVERYAATWATWKVPVIVNVAGESVADYVAVTRRLDGVPGIAGIELNISCPNVGRGGLQFAIDAEAAGEVTAAVRRATDLPLLVKLSPNVADIRPIAKAIEGAGADALTAINTLSGIAVAPDRKRPLLGNVYGGLSGPAIKPVALRIVYEAAQAVRIPVVAIGGVTEVADVLDFLAVGAVAVQVGTAIFADPTLPVRLVGQLEDECRRLGISSHQELVGSAVPKRTATTSAKGVEYRP